MYYICIKESNSFRKYLLMMEELELPIERLNRFFTDHVFKVYLQPTHDEDYSVPTNVKVELTGVKDYYHVGDKKPHVEYTIYILPTDETSDKWSKLYGEIYGKNVLINTSSQEYGNIRWIMNDKLTDFLQYFGVEKKAICTRVINEVMGGNINENLIMEKKYDNIVKRIVNDIISLYKTKSFGKYQLPDDLRETEQYYDYPQLGIEFSLNLSIKKSKKVKTFEVDGDLYYKDNVIDIEIIVNPDSGNEIINDLVSELNEVVRHEIEHILQYDNGRRTVKEQSDPFKYYTHKYEIGAQRAGFKKRARREKNDMESLVRNWFKKYPHKHNLTPIQEEKVIQKILLDK